jgi:nitrite reductase (NADH) large subunit
VEAIRGGCTSVPQVSAATNAGTGCGSCRADLAQLIVQISPKAAIPASNGTVH